MVDNILVSVITTTYNHENYIVDNIKGVSNQVTTFKYKHIIVDDCSTDNTGKKIRKFLAKHSKVKLNVEYFRHEHNKGVFLNFLWSINRAKGKYIAFCEGDDYWTDPYKLQKQVSFLEGNSEYSLTSHEVYYTHIYDNNSFRKFLAILYQNLFLSGGNQFIDLVKLFFTNRVEFWKKRRKPKAIRRYRDASFEVALKTSMSERYIPTMSVIVKREIINLIPEKLYNLSAGHRLIILWSAIHGKMRHFPEVMGVKNTQESSVTVTKIIKEGKGFEERNSDTIEMLETFRPFVEERYVEILNEKINEYKNKTKD